MSGTIPIVMGPAGLEPQRPADILAQLIANVAAVNPGYTANLPGGLIEDISSTDVAAIALCDSALVELVNSLTPYGANEFLLIQLGNVYGVPQGADTNTSVNVVFTGTPGFIVAQGFIISDGAHQYTIVDGGVIGSGGTTEPLFALAVLTGTWAVPANSVTTLVTSVPAIYQPLTVTNPLAGTPSPGAQSIEDYRVQVLQAGLAASQGMARYLRTLLNLVPGVQDRLVNPVQINGGGWEIIVGGGDPYQVAYAIYTALFDISSLVGSTMSVTGITNANPGVVTTLLNHGFTTGQVINISGVVGMSGVNDTPLTITVITEKTFSIGIDTTSSGAYVSGGVVTPNFRNQLVSLKDFPDVYGVRFVLPPQQTVAMTVTWNTSAVNIVSAAAMAQAAAPALVDYVNSVSVGQPMNLFELQNTFQAATADILATPLLTRLVFSVSINGIGTPPSAGTGIIAGDPESYFLTDVTQITIVQG